MINWEEILHTSYRAFISLASLFFVTKILGKKQVSQLSLFDYVIGISIGNFAAEMTINLESQEINGIVAVFIFGLVAYLISFLTMKSIIIRRFFLGIPSVVIEDGKILYRNMKKLHLDINDLLEQARMKGFFDISKIGYAVMEANGIISFKLKNTFDYPCNKDLNINSKDNGLCANVIIDGRLMGKNLKNMGKTDKWLYNKLQKEKVKLEDILLATLDNNNKLTIFEKSNICGKEILE